MGDNNIELKSISELLGMKFFIPSYQRGYRWTSQQVKDLLNDVWEFSRKEKSASEFYCLQPLVVKKNGEQYVVIDGQQRLTTIYLIVHYFNEMWEGKQKITELQLTYQTRAETSKALKNIEIGNDNEPKCESATDNIDTHHILFAYKTIHDWVLKQESTFNRDNFKSVFRHSVQVIWYEISENDTTNSIDTFKRLNIGKIPLTNAELIKALFLRKGNFTESAERWQIEIANEWDNMEYKLQYDAFWYFLTNGEQQKTCRIEFLFDVMCEIATDCKENIGTDDYKTFRFFNNKFAQAKSKDDGEKNHAEKIWGEIKEYFRTFEEWFEDPVLYHYIGYLVCCSETLTTIYNMTKDKAKDEFKTALKGKIKEKLKNVNIDELEYDKNNTNIRNVLLLLNIQHLIEKNKSGENDKEKDKCRWYIRFPFYIYKKENWDIEHIAPQTSPDMFEKFDFQKKWIEANKEFFKEKSEKLKEKSERFLNIKKEDDESKNLFDELNNKISNACKGEVSDDYKNGIGNLTLLNSEINRSYGNSIFELKRSRIIEEDANGKFIPICTKNVFLKYFNKDADNLHVWSENDYNGYCDFIRNTLKDFLSNTENAEEK